MPTVKRRKINLVSASEIMQAGGPEKWAKKVGYNSPKIKMSGIIDLDDKQTKQALKMLKK